MNDIIFSVIIPHKNTPELLKRCLLSIPRRNDVQIIVVDDNSDEGRVDFKNFPGAGEECVEVYLTKEGKGAGYARNVGLNHAKGKWLLFADADDFYTKDAFKYLFPQINSFHDIIYFKAASCYSDTGEEAERIDVLNINKRIENFIQNKEDSENEIKYKSTVPWGKMIKADFIKKNNINFEEVGTYNDVMFSLLAGHHAHSVSVAEYTIYYATVNKGSLTNTYNYDYLVTRYLVTLRRNTFLRKIDKRRYQNSIMYYLLSSFKYGIGCFFKFCKLAVLYKNNPFIGVNRWFLTYFSLRKKKSKREKYIVKE